MYRQNRYDFVVDGSNFNPYQNLQEMLVPFSAYKDAYEKSEEAYIDLSAKADKFKYLADNLDPDSQAAKIYNNYANNLKAQADDLARNGLNMNNRRALSSLKRRYQGEIGLLDAADTAMQEEKKRRIALSGKDNSMLYATDNLSIDQFLNGRNPNLYSISGDDLRREGAQYAQTASSRIYGNTQVNNVTKYFQEIMQTQGYSPEKMEAFRSNLESIPEFNQAVEDIMTARGVTENLKSNPQALRQARQNIVNGIMEGALYKETRSMQHNPGVLTAAQATADARQRESMELSARQNGYEKVNGKWVFNPELLKEKAKAMGYDVDNNKDDWEMGPDGKWHKKPREKQDKPKPVNVKLKEARYYDSKGNVSPISKAQNTMYGKNISFAEALKLNPSIGNHHPGYEDFYEYFDNNGKIAVVPSDSSTSKVPESKKLESKEKNEDDNNQI